jgi:hypothetical protein
LRFRRRSTRFFASSVFYSFCSFLLKREEKKNGNYIIAFEPKPSEPRGSVVSGAPHFRNSLGSLFFCPAVAQLPRFNSSRANVNLLLFLHTRQRLAAPHGLVHACSPGGAPRAAAIQHLVHRAQRCATKITLLV